MRRTIFFTFVLLMISLTAVNITANAKTESPEKNSIFQNYTPNTTIEYMKTNHWSKTSPKTDSEDYTDIDLNVMAYVGEDKNGPIYEQVLPIPTEGMRVSYDNWGEINRIQVRETMFDKIAFDREVLKPRKLLKAVAIGKRAKNGTYRYGQVVPETIQKTGWIYNQIIIVDHNVSGSGDMTCFTDKMGDHDNKLKKGDCATKGDYDNPKSNTLIRVKNMMNGKTKNFYKNDHGSLPNAVVDIWKTGVEYLGISSKNYNNIKKAAHYSYDY